MVLLSADYPHGITSSIKRIIQSSQVIKKEIKLERSKESFWFITQAQKFSQTRCFYKMIVQNNICLKKTFPEKSNDKTFKEIKNVYWAAVPVVQVNPDAVTLTFIL